MKNMWILFVVLTYSSFGFAAEDNKWIIGLGIGSTKYQESVFSDSDNLVSISGGYIYSDAFSIEAGYIDLGSVMDRVVPDDVISINQDTLSLEAKGPPWLQNIAGR